MVRTAAPSISATARLAKQSARALSTDNTSGMLLAARWLWVEAAALLEFARNTLYRCMKALSAVANFLLAMSLAVNRHRVSLMLQVRRAVGRAVPRYLSRDSIGGGSVTGSDIKGRDDDDVVVTERDGEQQGGDRYKEEEPPSGQGGDQYEEEEEPPSGQISDQYSD